jgi:hypothetical protein
MDTDITSIVFLAFLVLIPLGMITGIIILIVKKAGGRSGLKSIAERLGWEYRGSSPDAVSEVDAMLEPTLFAIREGRHEISTIASGSSNGERCWITEYHYRSLNPYREHRRSGIYSVLIIERKSDGPDLMIQHRMKGPLAAVAEKLVAGALGPASAPDWSWALTSSDEELNSLPRAAGTGQLLQENTLPGDMIAFFPKIVVWTRSRGITRQWADEVPGMISLLSRFQ